MTDGVNAKPTTAAEIMDLIRGPHWVTRDEAIALIEQYAAVVAAEACIKATTEAYDKCIGITDGALSKLSPGKGRPMCQNCGDPIAHGTYCGTCRETALPLPSADRRSV